MFCPIPGPWAARTSKDAETQNPGLPLESGRTSGPHRRWGGAVRRTSVLPQAKPWRRGNSLAPSMFNPIGAPIQLAVWGICPIPGPWAARTSKDAETQNPGLPLESGRTSGPHRRWGGAVRRTSVLPQAKPWRRGNSLAPSMFNPIGAPIQLAVWGICPIPGPWAARTSDSMQQKSSLAKGRIFYARRSPPAGRIRWTDTLLQRCRTAQRPWLPLWGSWQREALTERAKC